MKDMAKLLTKEDEKEVFRGKKVQFSAVPSMSYQGRLTLGHTWGSGVQKKV